jgi:Na+/H+ antiporter NhaD/arsenite permease-like protein
MKAFLFILILVLATATLFACRYAGLPMDHRQIESLAIFCALIAGCLIYEERRLAIAMGGVAALLALGLLSVEQFVASAGVDVVLFLLGTFLVAGYLEQSLFFEHLVSQIVRRVGPRPRTLIAVLMLSAMIASAIVGEVAAILFVGSAMLNLARKCRVNAVPFLMMLVFAANTGSAASAFGPVGVTIALKAHLSVLDFSRWATPIAFAVLGLVYAICSWWFAAELENFDNALLTVHDTWIVPDPISGRSRAIKGWMLILGMSLCFILHAQIEHWLGLAPNVILLAAALGAGAVALFLSKFGAKELIEQRVDWATLAFFLMLFASVGAMEAVGVTRVVAEWLLHHTGGRPAVLVLAVGWATGLLSALLANMLAVATLLPIVAQLKAHGAAAPSCIYWLMLFGATFMGNMTSIGSTCNLIACGMANKNSHEGATFGKWIKIGLIVSLSSMVLATVLLAVQTAWLSG